LLKPTDYEILEILMQGKIHFRRILDRSRKHNLTVRAALSRLIKHGFVREEGRQGWKRGKKLWYSLTEKGREKLLDEALKRVDESLRLLVSITSKLVAEKAMPEDWRKASREAVLNVKFTEDMPIEEWIQKVLDADKTMLLKECYKNMHRLICEVFLWKLKEFAPESFDPAKFFIGFPQGGLYFIHVQFLKEKGLYEEQRVFSDEGKRSQRHRAL
jgi:DNA-binding PadR family transcriptional regulator